MALPPGYEELMVVAASPLEAQDANRLVFSNNTNNEVLTRAFVSMPTDIKLMRGGPPYDTAALGINLIVRQQGLVDDSLGLEARVMSGSTVMAANDSGGTFRTMVALGNLTSTVDYSVFQWWTYVNPTSDGTLWENATLELRQLFNASMGADGCRVEVDYAFLSGSYRPTSIAFDVQLSETMAVRDRLPPSPPALIGVAREPGLLLPDVSLGNLGGGVFDRYEYSTDNGVTWKTATGLSVTQYGGPLYSGTSNQNTRIWEAPDGQFYVTGGFGNIDGESAAYIARLNADGSVDTSFTPPVFDNVVFALALQSDGKLLVGGWFANVGGVTQNGICRLNTDHTLDTGFNTGASPGVSSTIVRAIAIDADGKIVVGGNFTTARGVTQNGICRLNTDGTLDTGFNTGADPGVTSSVSVLAVLIDADGKILVGGTFTLARGVTQNRIARLNTDGSLDTGFNTGADPGVTNALGLTVNGFTLDGTDIIVCGRFGDARGVARNNIAKLDSAGDLVTTWNTGGTVGTNGTVSQAVFRTDGQLAIGGQFSTVRGVARQRVAVLNPADGTLDTTFDAGTVGEECNSIVALPENRVVIDNRDFSETFRQYEADGTRVAWRFPSEINDAVRVIAIQPDGKILVGGQFTTIFGESRAYLVRLNADATFDETWDDSAGAFNGRVLAIAIQADGKILVGGTFTTTRGTTQNRICRLNTDGTLDTGFNTGANPGVSDTSVWTIAIQPSDGKILIGGRFERARGTTDDEIRRGLARLNTDGSLDYGFNNSATLANRGYSNTVTAVYDMVVLPDGVIVVCGSFFEMLDRKSGSAQYWCRINADGSTNGNQPSFSEVGGFGEVMVVDPAGDFLYCGGRYSTIGSQFSPPTRNGLARFTVAGAGTTWNNNVTAASRGVNGTQFGVRSVNALAFTPDGKLVVAGAFANIYGANAANGIAVIDPVTETLESFNDYDDPGVFGSILGNAGGAERMNHGVTALAVDGDGNIWFGGNYGRAGDTRLSCLTRSFSPAALRGPLVRITETSGA